MKRQIKIVAVVAARKGSKGIPGKNLSPENEEKSALSAYSLSNKLRTLKLKLTSLFKS